MLSSFWPGPLEQKQLHHQVTTRINLDGFSPKKWAHPPIRPFCPSKCRMLASFWPSDFTGWTTGNTKNLVAVSSQFFTLWDAIRIPVHWSRELKAESHSRIQTHGVHLSSLPVFQDLPKSADTKRMEFISNYMTLNSCPNFALSNTLQAKILLCLLTFLCFTCLLLTLPLCLLLDVVVPVQGLWNRESLKVWGQVATDKSGLNTSCSWAVFSVSSASCMKQSLLTYLLLVTSLQSMLSFC